MFLAPSKKIYRKKKITKQKKLDTQTKKKFSTPSKSLYLFFSRHDNGDTIRTGREIQYLLYAGLFWQIMLFIAILHCLLWF